MGEGSVNHVGIATHSLDGAEKLWQALGFSPTEDEVVEEQGVRIRYMQGEGSTRIELLEPITEGSPIDKFLASKGPGVQQIAVNVSDIESKIEELSAMGFRMINEEPVTGSSGHRVAFIHPSSCGGVLVELVEFPQSES
tara:strand:+ start:3430 stop:3846 length:417 start_codon:yes stop_codon:yes gene_type:complete